MLRPLLLTTALALCLFQVPARGAPIPFPQDESDLKADPAITFGTLPNGLRYVVMPNHEPKDRASLRLLVLAGSFEETESQRGLAHYLEHMAFNGSAHYPNATLMENLQRLGMGIGADTNASTSFDRTLYQLDLPSAGGKTVGEGLQIIQDYCGSLALEQRMVDKERGIILSEKRDRDSVAYRTWVSKFEFMEGTTLVPKRLPIGLSEVIEGAKRDQFVDFYNTWYRPELMVVIAVGDFDGPSVVKQITDMFSGLAPRAPEVKKPDLGPVAEFKGTRTFFHSEPEAPETEIEIAAVRPYSYVPDTSLKEIEDVRRDIAEEIVNRRLEILSKKEGAPFIHASVASYEAFDLFHEAQIEVSCKPEHWKEAMGVADQELRQALLFGFRPDEIKEAVADFRNNLEQAVKTAPTRRSDALADGLAQNMLDRQVYTSPQNDLERFTPVLDKLTPSDCLVAFRGTWNSTARYVYVGGNLRLAGDTGALVKDAYDRAEAVTVGATGAAARLTWGYTDFGAPGTVASRTHVDDLDFTEVTFANGVRLNLKKTDFEANTIHVAVRIGSGQLTEPAAAEPGLSVFATETFSAGGLGKHSMDDLRRLLSGRNVGGIFSSTTDAFLIQGETNMEDLALEFQLLAAEVSDPGYRPESLRVARKAIDTAYTSFEHTVQGPLKIHVAPLLANGDPRFGLPSRDVMMARTIGEVRSWLAPELSHGAIEISVVGDMEIEAVISAVGKTFGALPNREPKPSLDGARKVSFPPVPFNKDFGIDSEIPKAAVAVYWPTNDGIDIRRQRRLYMLGEILNDRLRVRIREQLGSAYSPQVGTVASDVFPGYGYTGALILVDPAKAREIQEVTVGIAAEMAASGTTQDEVDRAKNPTLTHIVETERNNGYWMTVLGRAQERPEVLDWARTRRADFASISKEDMDALAKAYFGADHASRVIIHPYATQAASPLQASPVPANPQKREEPPPDGM